MRIGTEWEEEGSGKLLIAIESNTMLSGALLREIRIEELLDLGADFVIGEGVHAGAEDDGIAEVDCETIAKFVEDCVCHDDNVLWFTVYYTNYEVKFLKR